MVHAFPAAVADAWRHASISALRSWITVLEHLIAGSLLLQVADGGPGSRMMLPVTVLVPDGRVINTGGAGLTSNRSFAGDDSSIEAFEPPYLFRGVRPRIDQPLPGFLQQPQTAFEP